MFRSIKRLALALLTMLIISCQKDISIETGGGGGTVTPVNALLKMKIEGTQWTAGSNRAGASIIAGFININGTSTDGKSLSITLNDTVPGTYVLDQRSFNAGTLSDSLDLAGLSYASNKGSDTTQAGGTVIVSAIDKVNRTVSGTFHFKAWRDFDNKQKKITEGAFDKLPYVSTLAPARVTDTLRVTIDNVNWTAKSISTTISGTNLFITGSELDLSKLVALSVPSSISSGTYNLDVVTATYIGIYSPSPTSIMTSLSGKLTILEHNILTNRIRGNFSFLAVEAGNPKSSQLTAGYFSVVHQ